MPVPSRKIAFYLSYSRPWSIAVLIFCVLFGLALIASVQLAGDGSWYWWAHFALAGTKLYSGLHFSLQPLFVLETELFQGVFGNSWIASKVPAVLHLIAFAFGMFLLANKSTWTDRQKAIVLGAAFFIGIRLEAYRFDDYHVLSDSFYLYSIILLLSFSERASPRTRLLLAVALGILSGLTVVLRPNDGVALFCFSGLYIACNVRALRIASLGCLAVSAALAVLFSVLITGDSLITWATYSVLHVGSLKGGSDQFANDPINVFVSALSYVFTAAGSIILRTIATALCWSLLITRLPHRQTGAAIARIGIGVFIGGYCLYTLLPDLVNGNVVIAIHAIATLIAFFGGAFVIARAAQLPGFKSSNWSSTELLFLLPLVSLAGGSLSSAGSFADQYNATGFLILIYPIVWRFPPVGWVRSTVVTVLVFAGVSGLCYRFNNPASWWSYKTAPLFADRTIVDHPALGPMIIDNQLLEFITPICAVIGDGESDPEFLSMPWPFANYYCNVPPWHGYVQTWFDASSKPYIDGLISELRSAPPKWILYQREIGALSAHESIFNHGNPLPQRDLDELIMSQIGVGAWRIVRQEDYGNGSTWFLLRTQWIVPHGANLVENPTAREGLEGWHVSTGVPTWSHPVFHGGSIAVSYYGSTIVQSTLSHQIQAPPVGPSIVRVQVSAENIDPARAGYSVDVFDSTTNVVVGSLGLSHENSSTRGTGFSANFSSGHAYQLQLQFNTTGIVRFSNITITPKNPSQDHTAQRSEVPTSTLVGWTAASSVPTWSSDQSDGGRFIVKHGTADTSESTLFQKLRFSSTGPVTVQLRIGSDYLDVGTGYGYVADIYDVTAGSVAGSLGIPAIVSQMKPYSFTALVSKDHLYMIRLRFEAARGEVFFSHIKVEYGPKPTAWSDERSFRVPSPRREISAK